MAQCKVICSWSGYVNLGASDPFVWVQVRLFPLGSGTSAANSPSISEVKWDNSAKVEWSPHHSCSWYALILLIGILDEVIIQNVDDMGICRVFSYVYTYIHTYIYISLYIYIYYLYLYAKLCESISILYLLYMFILEACCLCIYTRVCVCAHVHKYKYK